MAVQRRKLIDRGDNDGTSSEYGALRRRAEAMTRIASSSSRREDHVAAAQAHVDAHGAARSKADREHHDKARGSHAKTAYPHLYGGGTPTPAKPPPKAPQPARAIQQGKKGGKFILLPGGRKKYLGKKGK